MDEFEEGQSDDDFSDNSEDEEADLERKLNRLMCGDPYMFTESQSITLRVGETFDSVYHLREVLRDYAVQEGIEMVRVVNDPTRFIFL